MRLEELKIYRGTPLEEGGTAHNSKSVSPPIRSLFLQNDLADGMRVLDYGAGKSGRNANWLRSRGVQVYAYDPHNGESVDGWKGVSNQLPTDKDFDAVVTSYVLNVVPDNIEDDILKKIDGMARHQYHITRNKDIFTSFKAALERKDSTVTQFFEKEFGGGDLSDENIMSFALHGSKTSKGFQRIPRLEHKGFNLVKTTDGYKIYTK